jgi:hypothetical protein
MHFAGRFRHIAAGRRCESRPARPDPSGAPQRREVPRRHLEEAQKIIADARAAGPAAAEEAEAASEESV